MIFLTGGTGLLGLHILDELRERSLPVTALVRDEAGARAVQVRGATPVLGTVESADTWKAMPECQAIIHGAAIIAGELSWERFAAVNVHATRLAARQALERGVPLVHISSVAVYGRGYESGARVDEAFPFAPLREHDYYARSKRMAEAELWEAGGRGLRAVALRPCVVYGEGDRLFLPKVVANLARSPRVPLIGGGTRPLALVHARNVAQGVVNAVHTPAAWGRAYNLTNDDEITARDFVAAVGRGLGRDLQTIRLPAAPMVGLARLADGVRRMLGPSRYPGSARSAVQFWRGGNAYTSERARQELNWKPAVKHRAGVENATRALATGSGR